MGVKLSDLPSSLFVFVFFCINCEEHRFLGSLSLGFFPFCSGWFVCWCILVPPCVHCFSVHCYRALLLLEIYPRWPSWLRVVFLYLLVIFFMIEGG